MAESIGNFSIDTFKAKMNSFGTSKSYLWNIVPNIPNADQELGIYLARSTSMPGKTIEPKEIPWQGMTYKIGGTTSFETWTVTFTVDGKSELYKKMVEWSDSVHDPATNVHGDPGAYMFDQRLDLLSDDGATSILRMKILSAWPSNVGPIELSYDPGGDLSTFDVEFTYLRHEIEA